MFTFATGLREDDQKKDGTASGVTQQQPSYIHVLCCRFPRAASVRHDLTVCVVDTLILGYDPAGTRTGLIRGTRPQGCRLLSLQVCAGKCAGSKLALPDTPCGVPVCGTLVGGMQHRYCRIAGRDQTTGQQVGIVSTS
jgi:hypothetical protein